MATGTAGLYATDVGGTVELFAVDENSISTQISPHDPETGEVGCFIPKISRQGELSGWNMEKTRKKSRGTNRREIFRGMDREMIQLRISGWISPRMVSTSSRRWEFEDEFYWGARGRFHRFLRA